MKHDRESIGRIAAGLAELRDAGEGAVIMSFGAVAPNHDCPNGHFLVTVEKAGEEATSEAVHMHDALLMARAKVNAQIAKREAEREKVKAELEKRP